MVSFLINLRPWSLSSQGMNFPIRDKMRSSWISNACKDVFATHSSPDLLKNFLMGQTCLVNRFSAFQKCNTLCTSKIELSDKSNIDFLQQLQIPKCVILLKIDHFCQTKTKVIITKLAQQWIIGMGKNRIQICGLLLRCEILWISYLFKLKLNMIFGFLHSLLAASAAALPTLGVAVMAAGRKRKKLWPGCACEASWVNCESSPTLLRAAERCCCCCSEGCCDSEKNWRRRLVKCSRTNNHWHQCLSTKSHCSVMKREVECGWGSNPN